MTRRIQGGVSCTKCHTLLPEPLLNPAGPAPCPACGTLTYTAIFPAILNTFRQESDPGRSVQTEQAGCFYHPDKAAVASCENCGRFICSLCEVHMGEQCLCPTCIATGKKKGRLHQLDTQFTLYDTMALNLALLPLLLVWIAPFTAPAALYLVLRHWKTPLSALPRTRIRFVFAFILAALQLLGLAALGIILWSKYAA